MTRPGSRPCVDPLGGDPRRVGGWQREVERRALAHFALGPHPTTVTVDDPLHCGEPDTGPLELRPVVQPLERAEELLCVAHVESDAVVLDEEHRLAVPRLTAEAHMRRVAAAREL